MPASTSSVGLLGARYSPARNSGAGNARVSSLPLTVMGSAESTTTAAGTMCAGNRSASWARIAAGSAIPVTYPTRRWPPAPSSRAITTACSTPSRPASAAWTSPGSTRNPRILTCSSARPTYCSCPSAPQRTRSPVRYMREPGAPANGQATYRDAVNAVRRTYPTLTPAPATYSSPTTPGWTGRNQASSTNSAAPGTGEPIGTGPGDPAVSDAVSAAYTVVSVGP